MKKVSSLRSTLFFRVGRTAGLLVWLLAVLVSCSKDDPDTWPKDGDWPEDGSAEPTIRPRYAIPDSLRAPDGEVLIASLSATGVQIYEVRRTAADTTRFEWAFVAPQATLYGADGFAVGTHYAGPTWESNDGSTVVGRLQAQVAAPNPRRDIPWLLLASRSNAGEGIFGRVTRVQRLKTLGGRAPDSRKATGATLGKRARIPYQATYLFYVPRP
ncbi:MAG: DUF3455 domain-containing protein [Ferruginibacter sp.]|nr:DUF3455 domain-containing protein [Cytophagales bacterium]